MTNILSNSCELYSFIEKHLPPKPKEKKAFGEVFTPLSLVQEMLNALDTYADPDFWKNPNHKILDPAAGIGNFPLIAYEKLMEGLKDLMPCEETRRKHILENMLYMIELNPVNVDILKQLFVDTKYRLNILCGDALKTETHQKLFQLAGTDTFDLIMGNPPFQGMQNADGKRGGGDQIWDDFIKLYVPLLKSKGFLVYVHPSGWRKPESERSKYNGLYQLMVNQNYMHYLEIHNIADGNRVFQSGTRYDWYVLQHIPCNNKQTIVKDETGTINKLNLSSVPFLPNSNFNSVFKLLAKNDEQTCDIIYSRTAYGTDKTWVKDDDWIKQHSHEAKLYKRKLIHSTPKSGIRYMWTRDFTKDKEYNTPMFGIPKVIFGDSGIYAPVIDKQGYYGLTQHSIGIKTPVDELENLASYLQSLKFTTILDSCVWSNFQLDWRLFKHFKKDFWKQFLPE